MLFNKNFSEKRDILRKISYMPVKYECSIKSALNVCLVFNCFHVSGYHRRGEAGGGLFLGTPACLQTRDKARAATQGINDKVTIMIMIRIT